MGVTAEWLGCATFRLTAGDLVVFLDSYIDRAPGAPAVGLRTADVQRADFVLVGHSHFDHLGGAEVIAQNTGARIIGSNETCRVMRERGVARDQLIAAQGGERHRLAEGVTVRVFPGLHACLWCGAPHDVDDVWRGDLGLTEDERRAKMAERNPLGSALQPDTDPGRATIAHVRATAGSISDGGPLVYLIETPEGSLLWQDTSGCWSGVLRGLRADVALLALSARPNFDGEPFQGSMAEFIAQEVEWLRPRTVIFGHHDNWLGAPDFTPLDLAPLKRRMAGVDVREPGYLEPVRVLG